MLRQHDLPLNQIAEPLIISQTYVKKVIRLFKNIGAVSNLPRKIKEMKDMKM